MAELFCCPLPLLLLLSIVPLFGFVAGEDALLLEGLQSPPETTMAVPVTGSDLALISYSVSAAESWLTSNVLAHHLPGVGVSSVVVGGGALCDGSDEQLWSVLTPALKNLYHCLARWGLVGDVEVYAAFSSDFPQHNVLLSPGFIHCMAEGRLRTSHRESNFSSYCVQAHSCSERGTSERFSAPESLGSSQVRETRPVSRKLSSLSFPSLPKQPKPAVYHPPIQFAPVPETSFAFVPVHSPSELPANPPDFSTFPSPHSTAAPSKAPAFPPIPSILPPARSVLPPAPSVLPPVHSVLPPAPSVLPPALPVSPPSEVPINPPALPALSPPAPPPAAGASAPGPVTGGEPNSGLWCVAKPTVPEDTLQEAMDYACGEGGADCHEIGPDGSCYFPDTVLAHASFAFNSYWQKAKHAGGSCDFDGTAVLISSDPSFQECHYVLN